jgi:hypothetical protein
VQLANKNHSLQTNQKSYDRECKTKNTAKHLNTEGKVHDSDAQSGHALRSSSASPVLRPVRCHCVLQPHEAALHTCSRCSDRAADRSRHSAQRKPRGVRQAAPRTDCVGRLKQDSGEGGADLAPECAAAGCAARSGCEGAHARERAAGGVGVVVGCASSEVSDAAGEGGAEPKCLQGKRMDQVARAALQRALRKHDLSVAWRLRTRSRVCVSSRATGRPRRSRQRSDVCRDPVDRGADADKRGDWRRAFKHTHCLVRTDVCEPVRGEEARGCGGAGHAGEARRFELDFDAVPVDEVGKLQQGAIA